MYFTGERICLITGANSGLGKAAAKELARLGAKLILVCRNHVRGEKALKDIVESSGNKQVHLYIADLSSQNSILDLTEKLKSNYERIDILINNAGAYFSKRHKTVDGIEATFAVNYLSRFLLINLLLESIRKSKQGRIINVSGEYHRQGRIYFDDLELQKFYSGVKANRQAKLADVILTYELSRRLTGTNITVNCMHPGFVKTNIIFNDPDASFFSKFLYKLISPFMKSPEKGAETILYLAASPEVTRVSGKYFINKQCISTSKESYDPNTAQELWKLSEEMLKIKISNKLPKDKPVNKY